MPIPRPAPTLRAAPPDPERHTGLPADDGFEELRALARARTAGAESAFERGLYLEAWFHSDAFRYSVDVDPGVEASDITTWLLDLESPIYRSGYVEHFTTAMAVLARTLDIPSRVVLGFAPGEPTDGETVVIRDRDAHAWVELWIPQHGWVAFDPTPLPSGNTTPTFEVVGQQLGFDLSTYHWWGPEPRHPAIAGRLPDGVLLADDDVLLLHRYSDTHMVGTTAPSPTPKASSP